MELRAGLEEQRHGKPLEVPSQRAFNYSLDFPGR